MSVADAVGSDLQIILEHTGQFTGRLVDCTESQIIVLIAHSDLAVLGQPCRLFRREESIGTGPADILLIHLHIVVTVLILDPAHRIIQIIEQIGTVLADSEIIIRRTDLVCRYGSGRFDERIDGDITVQFTLFQHLQ